jgi:hypothetical protein
VGDPRLRSRRNVLVGFGLVLLLSLALICAGISGARATSYPVLPQQSYTEFLSQLSVGALMPGDSGTLTFVAHNPLAEGINATVVSFEFYAFNPFPGNAPGALPTANAVAFEPIPGAQPTENATFDVGALAAGDTVSEAIPVQAPIAAEPGTYAIRTAERFTVGGQPFLLESRGYFTDAEWANATSAPNGNATLNVSRLGVSGVTPETGVVVQTNTANFFIWGLLVVSIVLAALAAFYVFRRGPGSRSGKRGDASPQSAPSAFGNNRTKDGD